MRRIIPRYSKENFPNVLKVVDEIQQIGKRHDASAGQVTLAWLLAQGPDIIPIPGTRNVKVRKKNIYLHLGLMFLRRQRLVFT
jgi:aryl-alcohol dehydrogenase-like predicted oxidoreductase